MIDLLYLSHNRREFTEASLKALIANTNWNCVARLYLYDDDSIDGTRDLLRATNFPLQPEFRFLKCGGPVAAMNHYLSQWGRGRGPIFAKIDSDTMVPAGWLDACLQVMTDHPELDLLGIEAFRPVVADPRCQRSYEPAPFIGGIGLMRASAFQTLPKSDRCFFGFTDWQDKATQVTKGWIDPALPVFLLDRMPMEPWRSLSASYRTRGWQRYWPAYSETVADLWAWWTP